MAGRAVPQQGAAANAAKLVPSDYDERIKNLRGAIQFLQRCGLDHAAQDAEFRDALVAKGIPAPTEYG
eukprot:11156930-Lingulodinium_polyedra.AAC.1